MNLSGDAREIFNKYQKKILQGEITWEQACQDFIKKKKILYFGVEDIKPYVDRLVKSQSFQNAIVYDLYRSEVKAKPVGKRHVIRGHKYLMFPDGS